MHFLHFCFDDSVERLINEHGLVVPLAYKALYSTCKIYGKPILPDDPKCHYSEAVTLWTFY